MSSTSNRATTALNIVADENIPQVKQRFSSLGTVVTVNGRALQREQLNNTDILLVRSVSLVNSALLDGTPVRFVGSATIGTDHLDTDYLDAQGIYWTAAPGSNADSVVEYIFSALCRLEGVVGALLSGARLGIVGMGNVGSRVYQRLSALGIECVAYDPLIEQSRFPILTDLATVLAADVICLHTPLTKVGSHPTFHLIDDKNLRALKPGTVLLNAGRGAVIDNQALRGLLEQRDDLCVVLDVWENEPDVDLQLMKRVDIATPHIAGYSFDGKLAGMEMLFEQCCTFLRLDYTNHSPDISAGQEALPTIRLRNTTSIEAALREAILSCYDVAADDQRMRGRLLHAEADRAELFDQLRKTYPVRREFSRYTIENMSVLDDSVQTSLKALGFNS